MLSPSGLRYGRPGTTPETLAALRRLCAKKALLEGRNLPLLLKSPPEDSGAIGLLAAAWPGARFVVIQRHPLPTLESQVRAWRQLLVSENAYLALLDRGYRGLFADAGARIRYGLFLHSQAGIGWLADCFCGRTGNFCRSARPSRPLNVATHATIATRLTVVTKTLDSWRRTVSVFIPCHLDGPLCLPLPS